MATIATNQGYAKSRHGILKIVEFIVLMLAWIFFYESSGEVAPKHYGDWGKFFFFTHLFGWIAVTLLFVIFFLSLDNSLGSTKCWNIAGLVLHFGFAVCCIVSSGYWAKQADDTHKLLRGEWWDYLVVAVICGFISFVVLAFDAFLSFKQVR